MAPFEGFAVIRTLATKCCYRERNEAAREDSTSGVGSGIWQVICIVLVSGGRPGRCPPVEGLQEFTMNYRISASVCRLPVLSPRISRASAVAFEVKDEI